MMQHKKIIERLMRGNCYNTDLNKIAYRYGARLCELKKQGLRFIVEYVQPGLYQYQVTKVPKKILKKYDIQ